MIYMYATTLRAMWLRETWQRGTPGAQPEHVMCPQGANRTPTCLHLQTTNRNQNLSIEHKESRFRLFAAMITISVSSSSGGVLQGWVECC